MRNKMNQFFSYKDIIIANDIMDLHIGYFNFGWSCVI